METKHKIFTIGHSNHDIETFLDLLQMHDIKCLADIRRFPASRRHPQFAAENLSRSLIAPDIAYVWLGERMGGFRDGGYDAYIATDEFQIGLTELTTLATRQTTAFMCAEANYTGCHRRFAADELARQNWLVLHILPDGKTMQHQPSLL